MNMNLQDASCEPPETVGGCQAVCITLPRDTRDTRGHTPSHVSHTFASQRKYREDVPVTDSRCHPGPVKHSESSWQTNWLDD